MNSKLLVLVLAMFVGVIGGIVIGVSLTRYMRHKKEVSFEINGNETTLKTTGNKDGDTFEFIMNNEKVLNYEFKDGEWRKK